MPIGLEVNDYDSDGGDVSSTEDDNLNLPSVKTSNKKIKKKKFEKKKYIERIKIYKG